MSSIYDDLSNERKAFQDSGRLPEWFTTSGWQLLSSRYLTETERDYKAIAERVSRTAAKWTNDPETWEKKFYEVIWNGWLSCSTPVLTNMGTDRGCPVSCSGGYIADSVYDFYTSQVECAMLSKNGFGTSSYLGAIRPRGTKISYGGKASGVVPVLKDFIQLSRDISQGCYDGSTEILTDHSWMTFEKLIEEKNSGTVIKVAFVNEEGKVDWVVPSDYIKYHYEGHMYKFTSEGSVDLLVTPNHNMVVYPDVSSIDAEIVSAEDIDMNSKGYLRTISNQFIPLQDIEKTVQKGFSGFIYCVTVPTSRLIVKRNELPVECGNSNRRGAWAGYIEIDHGDFWEIVTYLNANPDDCNIGWIISNDFIERLNKGDRKAIDRYQKVLKTKLVTGKGYFFFIDKVNDLNPQCYKDMGLKVHASNLCTEITLFSGYLPKDGSNANGDFSYGEDKENHTFTCVLSSMNLAKYDEWKDTDAVFVSTVFLDCVASEFIHVGKNIKGLENAIRFTEKSRALGLGAMGFHTYLQQKMIAFETFEAHLENTSIFKHIREEADKATKWMAEVFGEPEWCKGYGVRNSHVLSIAPNMSSSVILSGVSQGIEPIYKNVFVQGSAGGELNRINSTLLNLMKTKDVYNDDVINDIIDHSGSVQHVDWLNDHEKLVFKTAFEIDQKAIIRMASTRQKYIDQAQSINLFFSSEESEEYISEVHQMAFMDPNVKSLYYLRSEAGVQASKGECIACEG